MTMKLNHSSRTVARLGRDCNQDSFIAGMGPEADRLGHLFVICDGIGGRDIGDVASHLGCEIIASTYYSNNAIDRAEVLKQAFAEANTQLYAQSSTMTTTAIAAVLQSDTLLVAHVGNSRAYLLRNGQLRQITEDHTLIAKLIRLGQIKSIQEVQTHRNGLLPYRLLGGEADSQVDLWHEMLQPGDRVLLCTDGLHGHGYTPIEEIEAIVRDYTPDLAVQQLVVLAADHGCYSDVTAIVIEVNENDPRIANRTA
jgi:PPM family protein phosphatase